MKADEIIGEITRLVVHNDDFSKLSSSMESFNPLKVLDVYNYELKQLNMLSWLLNPQENHRLGDYFIKEFINKVVISNEENESVKNLSQIELHLSNFYDAQVTPHWKSLRKSKTIDLVIHSAKNNIVVIVLHNEKKENISLHMQECYAMIKEDIKFTNAHVLPVYLTDTGEEAPLSNYCQLTYEDFLSLIDKTIEHHHGELSERIVLFLKDYLSLVNQELVQDEKLVTLCQSIYREHKDIIHWLLQKTSAIQTRELHKVSQETINRYGKLLSVILEKGKEDPFTIAMKNFMQDKLEVSLSSSRLKNTQHWFYPIKFLSIDGMQQAAVPSWHSPYPVSYYFKKEQGKLKLKLEIGPFKDPTLRMEFIKFVNDNSNFTINVKAFRVESVSTCIKMEAIPFEDWEWNKVEIITTRMNHLYQYKFSETNNEILNLIEKFRWKIS
ncbi:hypothetical protein CIB95_06875 [Lottiidibacillus patelloidae]|uniref:Uncharacterized protein n=1 Tax=Lottiidibacillus patelloidae TaxID=2670334 RepID=A0A263BTX7_9BACI|nr:PD-(D/E)XK nuclease family protein [Lottiidibacillus patelloidae]OZM57184.1 hypothetical protein CIB95_06875 [Lottiidibacillus patelloidae]